MSEPDVNSPARSPRRRTVTAAVAAALLVLAVGLLLLALQPRSATATASATVTPRTDAGADAAVLLADRYAALAGSAATLRAAREATPALADVSPAELEEGTVVERDGRVATITVRVTLPDAETAAAAANAVVEALVEEGAGEDLVDVEQGTEAGAARAEGSPDVVRWVVVVALLALAAGLLAGLLTRGLPGRGRHRPTPAVGGRPAPPAAPAGDAGPAPELVDDLPGFLENPPGSVPALPAAGPAPASVEVDEPPAGQPAGATTPAEVTPGATPRGAALATAAAVLVLVVAAVAVAVTGGRSAPGDAAAGSPAAAETSGVAGASGAASTLSAPTASAAPGLDATAPTTAAPPSATAGAPGALALTSVPLGRNGVTAGVTFQGVLLEQRAVGLTVTYPSVSVSTDGRRSLAHVRLPTFNCLTAEPPDDPVAAGCARSVTEYADLAAPSLQLTRDGDRLELVGLFATYTRPNGTPPTYTGRAYQLAATITADGPATDGTAPAAGVVRIGLDSAATTTDPGVNRLQRAR